MCHFVVMRLLNPFGLPKLNAQSVFVALFLIVLFK